MARRRRREQALPRIVHAPVRSSTGHLAPGRTARRAWRGAILRARQPGGVTGAGSFQEFLGQVAGDPVFQLGFDEHRVNGIQSLRASAPPPLSCPLAN